MTIRDVLLAMEPKEAWEARAFLRFAQHGETHMGMSIHGKDLDTIGRLRDAGFLKAEIKPEYYNGEGAIHLTPTLLTSEAIAQADALDLFDLFASREIAKRYDGDASFGQF